MKSLPQQEQAESTALEGQRYCNALFALEKEFTGMTAEERYKQRQERARPILDTLLAWAETKKVAPKSALGKALHYLREQWPWLIRYLEDGPDPFRYLVWVLQSAPVMADSGSGWAERLLPEKAPEVCRSDSENRK